MSRLAKKPIIIPPGAAVQEKEGKLVITGAKGEHFLQILPHVRVAVSGSEATVQGDGKDKQGKANVGTMWSLLRNALQGVSEGFSKTLEIEGIGYRAAVQGETLTLHLGFSHPIRFTPSPGVKIEVEKNLIKISGVDKDLVGRTAAQIREFRKPEPYKGKGIRYRGEIIRMKVGKKATATGS